ncbi:phage tailspike protein [Proteus mirabilis]|uniref:phage tailspike protein n=1 Tax=Proteus mirabilis TaxID=584 RepID=UPI000D9929F2|nr:phage tailspike protein [Proteus mirabilis]SPY36469.1 Head binding [Proteus mirabilis]
MSDIIPNVVVSMPSQLFTLARKFQAASNGKIFIGKIDTDPTLPENQIQVYLENEDGSHIPVPQPLIINQAGFPVYNGQIAKFVTVEGHSMAVYDSYGAQQHYYPNVLKYDPDRLRQEIEQPNSASIINFSQAPYINRNVGDILSDIPTNKYFGAKCDGITDDTKANQEALDWSASTGRKIIFVGNSCISKRLKIKSGTRMLNLGVIVPNNFQDTVVIEVDDGAWRDPYNDGITAIKTGNRVIVENLCINPYDDVIDALGIYGTDSVGVVFTNTRIFKMRRGGVNIEKGYEWVFDNTAIIAPKDQLQTHDYAGLTQNTSDSMFKNLIVTGYTYGVDIQGDANDLINIHVWGLAGERTTRTMLIGLKLSGSFNSITQFYSDSPYKKIYSDPASPDNGGIAFLINGSNNVLNSPRISFGDSWYQKYGKAFWVKGTENTINNPLVTSFHGIEDNGLYTFEGIATPFNTYVYGGNSQGIYTAPMSDGFKPTINTDAIYYSQIYRHTISQNFVVGMVSIECSIIENSSNLALAIVLPPYLSKVSGSALGVLMPQIKQNLRDDANLLGIYGYINNGRIFSGEYLEKEEV